MMREVKLDIENFGWTEVWIIIIYSHCILAVNL